jgi:hypothetical protein
MKKSLKTVAEDLLEHKYLGKFVEFHPVGKDKLYGRVDRIALDTSKPTFKVIIMIDMTRFEMDFVDFELHINLLENVTTP